MGTTEARVERTADRADDLHLPRPAYNDKSEWDAQDDEFGPRHRLVLTAQAFSCGIVNYSGEGGILTVECGGY